MHALDRCEFKGKAKRKQKPTLCLSTRQRVSASFPAREIGKDVCVLCYLLEMAASHPVQQDP